MGVEPGRLVRVGGLGTLLGPEGSHRSSDESLGVLSGVSGGGSGG